MKSEAVVHPGELVEVPARSASLQAYHLLHWAFILAPILAGVDKFLMKLVDWTKYLWPPLARLTGSAESFMRIVGAIEIVAGFLVAFKPKIGAPIVAAWLLGIIINLLLLGNFFDIALRDFGLFLAALALARLAMQYDQPHIVKQENA